MAKSVCTQSENHVSDCALHTWSVFVCVCMCLLPAFFFFHMCPLSGSVSTTHRHTCSPPCCPHMHTHRSGRMNTYAHTDTCSPRKPRHTRSNSETLAHTHLLSLICDPANRCLQHEPTQICVSAHMKRACSLKVPFSTHF